MKHEARPAPLEAEEITPRTVGKAAAGIFMLPVVPFMAAHDALTTGDPFTTIRKIY